MHVLVVAYAGFILSQSKMVSDPILDLGAISTALFR